MTILKISALKFDIEYKVFSIIGENNNNSSTNKILLKNTFIIIDGVLLILVFIIQLIILVDGKYWKILLPNTLTFTSINND